MSKTKRGDEAPYFVSRGRLESSLWIGDTLAFGEAVGDRLGFPRQKPKENGEGERAWRANQDVLEVDDYINEAGRPDGGAVSKLVPKSASLSHFSNRSAKLPQQNARTEIFDASILGRRAIVYGGRNS
ncbi:hypothetical protein N2601_12755 [Rhizobium sp. CB3060]|uniref:hypothetical protein n=1 Tax=Rhizobium sp. CB3060 TaxID=3138255 RepID=UPI0021A2A591|nr:hypothetical protein [Rhizobium tropici]UWU20164.1 hypothetical protein N2601_12755 [Rhizobium tropici]